MSGWKKAIWFNVKGLQSPRQRLDVKPGPSYRREAKAFVDAAKRRGETCPVVKAIQELRAGYRYGWRISNKLNDVHHMRGRMGSLKLDKRHWMAVSRAGHRWIHSNINEARKRGWICEAGKWNVPDES